MTCDDSRPASVSDIADPDRLLAKYCDLSRGFAWPLYDHDPCPDDLSGSDLTAPALLSYPIGRRYLNEMGRAGTEYYKLVQAMREFLGAECSAPFWEIDCRRIDGLRGRAFEDDAGEDAFGHLIHCFDLSRHCKGLTSVFVTKVLHRKRPDLVPINDRRLRNFYDVGNGYPDLFRAIHRDVKLELDLLKELAKEGPKHNSACLRPLRVLDIVIWMDREPRPDNVSVDSDVSG